MFYTSKNKFVYILAAMACAFNTIAYAVDSSSEKTDSSNFNFSANSTLTSNYIWRGISQTENDPALQGSVTLDYAGFFATQWGSNVKFEGSDANLELDSIVGYKKSYDQGFNYQLSATRYTYPDSANFNFLEYNLVLGYKILTVGVDHSENAFNSNGPGTYYHAQTQIPLPSRLALGMNGFSVGGILGYYDLNSDAGNSYTHYGLLLDKQLNSYFDVSAAWSNSNGSGTGDLGASHFLLSLNAAI